jgi:hypothetical protein
MHTAGVISTHIDVGVVIIDDINGADGANSAIGANG